VALPWPRELDPWLALGLMAAHVLSPRVRFYIGAGYTVPTQVVLVPMLFLLPTPLVPALVALAQLVGDLPDLRTRRLHPERALHSVGDSWYALAPALILTVTGATPFQPDLWPIYLFALAGQFVLDLTVNAVRDWFELGVPPRLSVTDNGLIYAVDGLLAPVGLLAAAAGTVEPWLFALVVPQVVLLDVFARERQRRLDGALELRHAYQGTSALLAELLQDDDEYTGMHSKDVVSLAVAVATQLGLDSRRVRDTEFAALLHDIGKIAVPKEIINKPGPLSEEEWAVMRTHTLEGQRMLDQVGGALQRGRHDRACVTRALGRPRLSGRPGRRGDSGRGPDRRRLRRLSCDDLRPQLPQGPPGRACRRGAPGLRRQPVRPGVVAALVDVVRLSQPLAA
jgi:putative nucleotidyltransferase with HDIG domain